MTGFDATKALSQRDKGYDRAIMDAVMRPVLGNTPSTPSTSLWQDTLHLLGKGEEVTAKLLGQLFTDDPKYDNAFGSSDYWSQIGFYELAKDAGINQENFGTAGPALAAVIGLGAALINPLDPLNKLKILGLTRSGVVGKRVDQALEVGGDVLETFKQGGKEFHRLNKAEVASAITRLEKDLAEKGLTGPARQHAARSLRNAKEVSSDMDRINELLHSMEKSGMKLDDIRLADTRLEQIRRGQSNVLGFSSPLSADHMALLGVGKAELDHAVRLTGGSLHRRFESSLVEGVDKLGKVTSDIGRTVLDKMGVNVIKSAQTRELLGRIKSIIRLHRGNTVLYKQDMNALRQEESFRHLTNEDFMEVINKLEEEFLPDKMAMKDIVADLPSGPDQSMRAAKSVKELTEEEAQALGVRFESRLTEDDKLILTPSGIDPQIDLPRAVEQYSRQADYPAWELQNGSKIKITGDFVIYEPGTEAAALSDINALNKSIGQRTYVRATDKEGKTILVARRLSGGVPISSSNMFEYQHMDNLEAILAKLAVQKKSVQKLEPEDFLINPLGGVQLINPDKIIEFSGKNASSKALVNSRQLLDLFVEENSLIGKGGGLREYRYLQDLKSAKRAPKVVTARRVRDGHGVESQNVHDLLQDAVNTGPEKAILRGMNDAVDQRQFLRISGVEQEYNKIQRQIARGEAPVIEPIVVSVDARGNLFIVNGQERAVAAAMSGMDVVPTTTRPLYGEKLDLTRTHYVGRTMDASEFFHGDAGRGIARDVALEEAGVKSQSMVSPNYKVITEDGKGFQRLNDPTVFQTDNAEAVLSSVGALSVRGLRAGREVAERPQLLRRALIKHYGDEGSAAAAISDLVASSPNASEFTSRLHQIVNKLSGRNGVLRTAATEETVQAYNNLRRIANANLEELSSRGIICNACIKNQRHRDLFLQNNPEKTLVILDDAANSVTYASATKDAKSLSDIADSAFKAVGGAEEVAPHTRILMTGPDGTVVREASEFVSKPHPRLADTITAHAEGVFPPEEIERLRSEHGVVRNPGAEDVGYIQRNGKKIGVPLRQTDEGVKRQNIPFFITRAGDMFISTRHDTVPKLLGAVFEGGPQFFQETGVITARGIIVDNPLGALMSKAGKSEVRALEKRVKQIALKLDEMGVHHGMRLHFNTPFDGGVWSQMYGKTTTLGDVVKRGWKLDVPELIRDMPLDLSVSTSQRVIGTREPRFRNKDTQRLFEILQRDFDELFVEEFLNGITNSYHASYFPRFATKEAKDAFNSIAAEYFKNHPKVVTHIEPFLKKRTFTDMTTEDINKVVAEFARGDKPGITPTGLFEDILEFGKKELGKELDPADVNRFLSLVDTMPSGVKFFHDDAIYAATLRFESGQKALARQKIVEELEKAGAIWSGSPTQLNAVLRGKDDVLKPITDELALVKEDIARLEGELDGIIGDTPDVTQPKRAGELQNQIAKKNAERAKLEARYSDEYKKFVGANNGPVADHIDRGQIFISGEDAERLVSKGVLSPDDFPKGFDDTLVRVPFEKVTTALPGGIKIHAFDPAVASLAKRLFGLETKAGFNKFLQAWDHVHDLWRTWTLFPIPAFHFRNALSSFTMNYLGGVTAPRTYEDTWRLFSVLRRKAAGGLSLEEANAALDGMEFFNAIGQRATGRDLWAEFTRRGGPQGGFFVNEFSSYGSLQRADDATRLGVRHGLVPSSEAAGAMLTDNFLIRGGLRFGSGIESRMRFAAFLETWQKSGSFDAAERAVKAIHYDYSDLNAFERDWLRRVIPFYSWSRHNIPQMFKTMATNPIAHVRLLRMVHQIEQGATGRVPPDESGIPEYMREKYGVILHQGDDGKYFMKVAEGIFPIFDAYKILGGSAMEVIGQGITPFAKFPIEQLMNHSFFTGSAIENFQGEPSTRRFTLGQLGFSRRVTPHGPLGIANYLANDSVVRDFFRVGTTAANLLEDMIDPKNWVDGEPTIGVALWDFLLGRGKVVDPEKTRASVAYKRREMLGHLRRAKAYYKEAGNTWLESEIDQRIMNFVLEHGGDPK